MHDVRCSKAPLPMGSRRHKANLDAVERAFGSEIDYPMLVKHYGPAPEQSVARRYSPAECGGTTMGAP